MKQSKMYSNARISWGARFTLHTRKLQIVPFRKEQIAQTREMYYVESDKDDFCFGAC